MKNVVRKIALISLLDVTETHGAKPNTKTKKQHVASSVVVNRFSDLLD